jgi:ribosomal protein L29
MKEAADSLMVQDLASLHEELDDPELKDLLRESVGSLLSVRQEAKTVESQFTKEHEDYMATIASIKTQNVELTPD